MTRRSPIAVVAAVVAAITAASALAVTLAAGGDGPAPVTAAATTAQQQYPVEADYCYVAGMIPHHEQALLLSELVLAADAVPERVRALADFIQADQSAEIVAMQAWGEAWAEAHGLAALPADGHSGHHGGVAVSEMPAASGCTDTGVHDAMPGMVSEEGFAALRAADGIDAALLFLELMIPHHDGALEMAETAVREGTNAFVESSAKHVIIEQAAEITAMRALIDELRA